jgi:hypothetical protein
MICQRCDRQCSGSTGSYFDTAQICFRCDEVERSHPAFEEARRVESEEVGRGNFNFRGVGVPSDLVALCVTAAGIAEITELPDPEEDT